MIITAKLDDKESHDEWYRNTSSRAMVPQAITYLMIAMNSLFARCRRVLVWSAELAQSGRLMLRSLVVLLLSSTMAHASVIHGDPTNYSGLLKTLQAGDTLLLAAGSYTNGFSLNSRNGTEAQPIVIIGMDTATVLVSRACCNTISITQCSYLVISHLRVEGADAGVDALKAEGTTGNWAHHITVEYLTITNFQSDQQVVGINTKCPCWNWIIRKNRILGAGTGLYLGNSDGTAPFVNGDIEYNYISGTLGYCMEIKHQVPGVRDAFPGTAVDGRTLIAHNVFTKDASSSTGTLARPNLLVGGFASTGWGSHDYYEIVGNFFYENSTEALFQGSGSMVMYNNVFINHSDGDGARAVYITQQNNIPPQNVLIFHNTIVANNSNGGIRMYNADANFQQLCFANAVYAANAISNVAMSFDNVTDNYAKAASVFLGWSAAISQIDLIPQNAVLFAGLLDDSVTKRFPMAAVDFNGSAYDWHYRGAYAGCCSHSGWTYSLDTMTQLPEIGSGVFDRNVSPEQKGFIVHSTDVLMARWSGQTQWRVYETDGRCAMSTVTDDAAGMQLHGLNAGMYFVKQQNRSGSVVQRIVIIE